jgi:hypothetical protein
MLDRCLTNALTLHFLAEYSPYVQVKDVGLRVVHVTGEEEGRERKKSESAKAFQAPNEDVMTSPNWLMSY